MAKWITDVYLQTDLRREQVFQIVSKSNLGKSQPLCTLIGESIEICIRRNPDNTGDSMFGFSPLVIEVAKPEAASTNDFQAALKVLFKILDAHHIPHRSVSEEVGQ